MSRYIYKIMSLIIVLLLSKNSYVFTQKREKLGKALLVGAAELVVIVFFLIAKNYDHMPESFQNRIIRSVQILVPKYKMSSTSITLSFILYFVV